MDQFIQKPKKRKRGNLDPWGNPYKTDNLAAFTKSRRPRAFSSRNSKNNSRVANDSKKEKLSKSDLEVR